MTLNYNLTDEDFLRFNFYHSRNLPSVPKNFLIRRITSALWLPVLGTAVVTFLFHRLDLTLIALAVGSVFAIYDYATFPKSFNRGLNRQLKVVLDDNGYDGLTGPYRLELTDHRLIEHSEGQTLTVAWSRVRRVGFDGGRVYLYSSSMQAFIVPLSVFTGASDFNEFSELLRGRTGLPLNELTAPAERS